MAWTSLPDGTFVQLEQGPAVVVDDTHHPWALHGYGDRSPSAPRQRHRDHPTIQRRGAEGGIPCADRQLGTVIDSRAFVS